ncbi:MAG: trypsin-like peptidase domain-containing protein [Bacteroidales bacterium]|nr:trypsin-like peptidase domain-containing protein [Bacteroidales bacterium]
MSKNVITVIASVALSALTAFGITKAATPSQGVPGQTVTYSADGASYRTVNLSQTDYPDFTYAAESAVDAVVYVKVTIKTTQRYQMDDPFFRFFFGDEGPQTREREAQGSGSGVIIRPDGYIVTNNHVVQNATKIEVTLNNNKVYEAQVIGTDPATDVALIKIDAVGLPTVEFADSDKLRLGEWVLAIGSPLGEELRSTITAGIVSAKGRSMPNYNGEFKIESFIQTDAAVNPGNSGGALVNKEGKLVGINTAIVSTTGSYAGYSFAVPSNIVSKIVSDLIDFGAVKRAKLGIEMSPVTEQLAEELKLSSLNGVYIHKVTKGGAADKAGMKEKDILVAIDSTVLRSTSAVQEKVNSFHPGDKATLTVIRDGKEIKLPVTFQGMSEETGTVVEDGSTVFYGARLRTAPKETLDALRIRNGVEIVSAGNGKMAAAGAGDGYIIQYVNDQAVSKPQDIIDLAKKSKRAIFVEGVTPTGRSFYFGFGKDE